MNMKKRMNFWLMAALLCGLGLSFASCSSDDDDAPATPTEEPINGKPGDAAPDDVSIDEELRRLLNEHNGAEDSIYFFLEEAQKEGNFINVKYEHGFNSLVDMPEHVNAYEYAVARNEAAAAEDQPDVIRQQSYQHDAYCEGHKRYSSRDSRSWCAGRS